ncbi:alpha/beta fold hydrolase [Novosphingobium cyanobacteriorum]|uniref:Alpha/beta hydrolase n=1 Tax=Novosphingobium cyanobacteriorum TaxID=3024215 RepID=A0ABT6CLW5_9SPHN|nr:alpha/beta hydrolase [Novosphingobium cyanobacteriorum]MDF8334911.1 alpha/beta hydrolase [Novosphingobium cyanobacteriorum]
MAQAAIRGGYADWDAGQVHYRHAGHGPAVILLGGAPRSGAQFEPVMAQLAAAGYLAIAPDIPGFGASSPAPAGFAMEEVAGFLLPVLDALGLDRVALFGLHSGHKVAAAFAAKWPDRTAGLIVAGKSHSIGADQEHRNATVRGAVVERYFANGADEVDGPDPLRGWAAQWRNLTKLWWDDALHLAQDKVALLKALEARIIDDLSARRTVRDFYRANFAFDLTGTLARVQAPVLLLEITSAGEDGAIGRQGAALAAQIGGARLLEVPETDPLGLFFHIGHDRTAEIIAEFLAEGAN